MLWISLFCLQTVGVLISGNAEAWFIGLNVYLDISTAYIELQLHYTNLSVVHALEGVE